MYRLNANQQTISETQVVARGAFINLMGNLGKLSHFVFDIIATRVLGQAVFGYFSTTWLIMNLAFIVCYFGAHRLVIDFVVKSRTENDEEYYKGIAAYVYLSFMMSAFLVLFMQFFAGDIARWLDKPPLEEYLKIMSWSAPFYCLTTILLTATRGLKFMKFWVFVRNGAEPFLDLTFLCIIFFSFSVMAAPFYAKALGFTGGCVVSLYFFNKFFSFKKIFRFWPSFNIWKRVVSFGLPVMFADFLSIVILKVDVIVLSILAPAGQVAVFQIILNIANTMRNIPQAIDPIMMPVVVEMRQKQNYEALEKIYATIIHISFFLSTGFFVLNVLFGHLLLNIYGSDFVYGSTALMMTCFGIMLHTIFSSVEPVLIMSGFPYLNLFNNIFFVLVNLVIDFLLIPSHGILGAAIGCVTASALTAGLQLGQLYFKLKLRPIRWDNWLVAAFGGAFFLIYAGLDLIFGRLGINNLTIQIFSFISYLVLYLYFGWKWIFHDDDRLIFSTMLKKKQTS